jgi:hypothetical protein
MCAARLDPRQAGGMGWAHSGGASAKAWPEATAVNMTDGIANWSPLSAVAASMPWVRRIAASSSYQAGLLRRGKPTQSRPARWSSRIPSRPDSRAASSSARSTPRFKRRLPIDAQSEWRQSLNGLVRSAVTACTSRRAPVMGLANPTSPRKVGCLANSDWSAHRWPWVSLTVSTTARRVLAPRRLLSHG